MRGSWEICAITDARFGCSSPPFQLAQKFCHHKPISQAGNIIGLWWQIFCANAKDLHTNGKGGLLQMHRASLWLCKVGSDIGLWWLNFHANGKDGLLQLHWTSVFLRSSRNKWPDFFYHQPYVSNPAMWCHLVYAIYLHLFTQNVRVKIMLDHRCMDSARC